MSMQNKERVLVIGSNSFSGGDFVQLLLESGRFQVYGVSRSPEKGACFLEYHTNEESSVAYQQINLNQQMDDLMRIVDDFRPDYLVNFAAQGEVGSSWVWPTHWFQTNAVAITELAQRLKEKKFIRRYLHVSTPEVYGTCRGVVREDAPLNPSTPYAASKAAGDLSLMTFFKSFAFPVVFVRATNVYGPRQQLYRIIPRTMISILKGEKLPLHGGGKALKSYIHIRDVSRGELMIMEKGRPGEVYHLSPSKAISIRDLVAQICENFQVNFEDLVEMTDERLGQDPSYVIDSTKARQEFSWEPQISFEEGLLDVQKWIETYWEEIRSLPVEYQHQI